MEARIAKKSDTINTKPFGKVVSTLAFVKVREGEAFEGAFRRFKKSCEKSGILSELKKREHFEKPSIAAKKKSIAARKRMAKKQRKHNDF